MGNNTNLNPDQLYKKPNIIKMWAGRVKQHWSSRSKFVRVAYFSLIFAAIGVLVLGLLNAAGLLYIFEAEDSNLVGKAVVASRDDASMGQVLQFGKRDTVIVDPPPPPPPPPTTTGVGVWITKAEIMNLPDSGSAWNNLASAATGSLGSVNLADNNSTHDTNVLALSYYAVRKNDSTLVRKVAQEIDTVKGSSRARALEFCRNITSYIISADVINLGSVDATIDKNFRDFIRQWVFVDTSLTGHSGSGIKGTASNSATNWGGMCRAAYAATAVYLGDNTALNSVANWQKGMLGDSDTYDGFRYSATNWHANPNDKVGINRKGATIQGQNVDGVIPEDQRRTGEFVWPAPKGSYPWEAMQGLVVTDVILQRRGLISNNFQDSAIVRSINWLYYVNNNPPSSDDTWIPFLVNKIYGTSYPESSTSNPGKLMAWTDWTHN